MKEVNKAPKACQVKNPKPLDWRSSHDMLTLNNRFSLFRKGEVLLSIENSEEKITVKNI
ncbi:hypothetical protein [Vibrio sp. 10N.261.55.A7]|uniref:hypothetical protein n=1 Tax=Vibrio sp. 10N.261.55.A7 TaxID=1880851 RepID=UPI001300041D|nr:hypothetical protein [Vibrio sp. 10N.261.55.A7]